MKNLKLHYSEILQGDFDLKKLNLLLLFQVNCPGCFSYALPVFNKLFSEFNSCGVSFLAISTAFEDFDKNTLNNTKELIKNGTLIGETRKFMKTQGIDKLPYSLNFPIAMDKMNIDDTIDLNTIISTVCELNPNYDAWPELEKKAFYKKVEKYLKSLDQIALTFTLNQLRGTPSFILFNSEYEILSEWFGHVENEEISRKLAQYL